VDAESPLRRGCSRPGVSAVSSACVVAVSPLQCAPADSDGVAAVGSPFASGSTLARWSECMATPERETATPKENQTRSLGGITENSSKKKPPAMIVSTVSSVW